MPVFEKTLFGFIPGHKETEFVYSLFFKDKTVLLTMKQHFYANADRAGRLFH